MARGLTPGRVGKFFPAQKIASYEDANGIIESVGKPIYKKYEYVIAADAGFDSQLILQAYLAWGEACVNHLEGSFAFVIWNRVAGEIFIGIDALGSRPLYYHDSDDRFVFCSEFDCVLATFNRQPEFNFQCLNEALTRNFDASLTYVRGIRRLIASSYLRFFVRDSAAACRSVGFTYQSVAGYYTDVEWIAGFQHRLRQAVTRSLAPGITVGVSLSGGLDSSAIACILAAQLAKVGQPLHCFCAVLPKAFPDRYKDERAYMQAIAGAYPNIILHYVDIPDTGFFEGLTEAMATEPTFPNIFQYHDRAILRAAALQGVQVLYSGYGGDHFASWSGATVISRWWGKGRFRKLFRLLALRADVENINIPKAFFRYVIGNNTFYRKIRSMIKNERAGSLPPHRVIGKKQQSLFYRDIYASARKDYVASIIRDGSLGRVLSCLNARAGRYGVDFAFPFLDTDFLSFLAAAPSGLFVADGRSRGFIRKAMRDVVPDIVLNRTDKQPYSPGYSFRFKRDNAIVHQLLYPPVPQSYERFINMALLRKYYQRWLPGTTAKKGGLGDIQFMQWMTILYLLHDQLGGLALKMNVE